MTEAVAALLGALVGIIGTYFFSLRLLKDQRRQEAASRFREAFAPEAAKCKAKGEFRIKEVVAEALPRHEKAVILYEPFVKDSELMHFRSSWEKYCALNEYSNLNDFAPEPGIGNEGYIAEISEREQRANTLSHINGLLKYAPVT